MNTSAKTAKNLLNDTSCYQCIFFYSEKERCAFKSYKDLHEELFCDNFKENKKIHIGQSKQSVIGISTSYPADVEAELIKAVANELKSAIDDCIEEKLNEKLN